MNKFFRNRRSRPPTRKVGTALRCLPMFSACIILALSWTVGYGQERRDAPTASAEEPTDVSVEAIDAALRELSESTDLDEALKARLKDILSQARRELETAAEQGTDAAKFLGWVDVVESESRRLEMEKVAAPAAYDFSRVEQSDMERLVQDRDDMEKELGEIQKQLAEVRGEIPKRVNRRSEIPSEIATAETALAELNAQLQRLTNSNEPQLIKDARKTLLQSRAELQRQTIAALRAESKAYETEGDDLPRLRIAVLTQKERALEQDLQRLSSVILLRRERDVASQREAVANLIEATREPLLPLAQACMDLIERRIEHLEAIRTANSARIQSRRKLSRWEEDFARTELRAKSASADLIGPALLEKQSQLPSVPRLAQQISDQETTVRALQDEIFKLEDRHDVLLDMDAAVLTTLERLRVEGIELPADAPSAMREILKLESRILDRLLEDLNREFNLRVARREDERRLSTVVKNYQTFIGNRVLWVRNAPLLGFGDGRHIVNSLSWIATGASWQDARDGLINRLQQYWMLALLLVGGVVLVFSYRRRAAKRLTVLGEEAGGFSCLTFRPTSETLLLTVLLALRLPLLCFTVGWLFRSCSNEFNRALSLALTQISLSFFAVQFARQVCRRHGLAECHLGWLERSLVILRRNLRLVLVLGLPLAFAFGLFEHQRHAEYLTSTGRVCLIAFLLLLSYCLHQLFRPECGIFAESLSRNSNSWANQLRHLWHPLIIAFPILIAAFAANGYMYTSLMVAADLFWTLLFCFGLVVLGQLLNRIVRLRRRRFRREQLLEAREQAREGQEPDNVPVLEALAAQEEEIDLVEMDRQARGLIRAMIICLAVAGFSAIWIDALPVLSPVLSHELWQVDGVGGIVQPITVRTLLLAIFVIAVATVASRNIPGLVDVMFLGRLGIQSATRYAISTLSRYFIVIIGILIACAQIGFTWSKAQWLIAALSVGLGFGLQEIVANFVCGILLLFERPLRVGDIVTLGDTTGVVTRIRTRATTIRNWERQEVVIPNKELITGRITNWSLSDSMNRVVISVGVAYGTDTRRVREVLCEILAANENVLDEPAPLVTFDLFGDSSLNFTIRAFLAAIDQRLETTHTLHTEIHERFAREGIEISFPQRDLHLRSIDPNVSLGTREPASEDR